MFSEEMICSLNDLELEVYKYATGKTESVSVVLSEQIPD